MPCIWQSVAGCLSYTFARGTECVHIIAMSSSGFCCPDLQVILLHVLHGSSSVLQCK